LNQILEVVLAFGNYMNSGKRGSVYGFKLTSLEALVETKSTDKSQNLLHYICNVVHSYFTDVADFMCEIRYVDQAAKVSLDTVMKEVNELKTGMQNTTKEYETHKQDVLGHFLAEAGNKVDMLDADAVEAQEAYRKVVTYFGETSKTMPPETFFPMFDRFIKAYGKAETHLEKWNLLQQKNLEKREQRMKEEAERQAQEAAAAAAPTEKDMINDIRENRRRERRQVSFKLFRNIELFKITFKSISKGTNWGKYISTGGSKLFPK
jgi:hemerythrin